MTAHKKSEYIPLLESDHHDWKDDSDGSSNFTGRSSNYGSNILERRTTTDDISELSYAKNADGDEIIKNVFGDFNEMTLSWSNINCYAPGTNSSFFKRMKESKLFKQLLFGVSGVVKNGTLMAIMGASGAGKSTLLNVLTCRNLGKIKVDGEVRVNGVVMDSNIKRVSAYVQQLDVFSGRLKVHEHLLYNAILRMGKKHTRQQILERIDVLIKELGLSLCKDEYINSNSYHCQGLAGSEKKLLSIACELLCDPPIIFLDEPTTGLDSMMAERVLNILQKLSLTGKCIICTIHQPSSFIYQMFNVTYLLAEGRLIFQGNRHQALEFFSECGFPCGDDFNPADHFIHTLAIRPGREADCRSKVQYLSRKFQDTAEYGNIKKDIVASNKYADDSLGYNLNKKLKSISLYKASYWQEIRTQTWKQGLDQVRDSKLFLSRILQNFISTVILSLMVMQQKYDQVGVINVNGGIFSVVNNISFLAVIQYSTFVMDLKHHRSEHQIGMCRSGSYFIAKSISDLPFFFITITTCVVITYWSMGLYPRFLEFIIFFGVSMLIYQFSFSLNIMFIGSIIEDLGIGITITTLTIQVMMLLSGFMINYSNIPVYFKWLSFLSCQRFGFEILSVNQWKNVAHIECSSDRKDLCYNTGEDVIKFLGFSESRVLPDLGLLIGLVILFKVASLLSIIIKAKERKLN